MVINLANIGVAVGNSRNRVVLLIIFVAVSFALGFGIYEIRHRVKAGGVAPATSLTGAPQVQSIPGVGTPSREYVKLQQEANVEQVKRAERTGTAAVPTIVRESYIGRDDLAQGFKAPSEGASAAKGCDVESLRRAHRAGVTAFELRCRGCSAKALRAAGYTAGELRAAGFSARDLKAAGFNAAELKAAGYSAAELRRGGFSPSDLKAVGFTDEQLKAAGFTAAERGKACDVASLKAARQQGVSASELKRRGCDAAALKAAGYTAKELKAAGFTAEELKKAGFSDKEIKAAGYSCDIAALKRERAKGVSAAALRKRGCGAAALRAAGYTAGELRDAGFSAAELKDAGFTAAQLKAAGFSAKELKDAGFSARELKAAGFTAGQLAAAGFSAGELKRAGFSGEQLKAAGFSAADLRRAGFTAAELKAAGFSAKELKKAGYTNGDLIRAGVSAANIARVTATGRGDGAASRDTSTAAGDEPAAQAAKSTPASEADARLARLQRRQAKQVSAQARKARLNQLQQGMGTAASTLMNTWSPPPIQTYVAGQPPKTDAQAQTAAGSVSGVVGGAVGRAASTAGLVAGKTETVKAGTIMFAVLDTSINSDEPSPVLATIVQGKFKGAKLIGEFKLPNKRAGRVVVKFTQLSLPNRSRSIALTAVAINANTSHTALADYVNHHYMLRYGTLIGASVLSGIGDAVVKSGSTSNFSQFGVQISHEKLSQEQLLLAGIGKAGKEYSRVLGQNFHTPTTVKVFSGTGIGVLFTQDLSIPPPIPEDNN